MKYISFIDQLGIDIDQLSHIDDNGIIKLQKQLKAKAMLGNANNLGEIASVIDQLKDETNRQHHIFIEKHQWLKQLISGEHEFIKQGDIEVDESQISNLEDLKYFLAPYLKDNLKLFLSETLNKGNYVVILKILGHNNLFSEENNQLVINFFKARLNYATVYLREKRLKDKEYPVAFITNKVFINCLNQYPDCFNEDIQELNSEVIDVYNSKRRNIDNKEFRFAAKAMVAFSILDTSNIFLEETLKSNADIAREYTYPSRSSRKTGSGYSGWGIFVMVMIIIRVVLWVGKSSTTSNDYIRSGDFSIEYNDKIQKMLDSLQSVGNETVYPEIEETVIESDDYDDDDNSSDDRYKLEDHIKFIYTLKRNVERKDSEEGIVHDIVAFSNPYPKTFNKVPNSSDYNDNTFIKINNDSQQDLIVFRLKQGIDQSVFIPKNKNLAIEVVNNDSLVFYTGKDFVFNRFSHFMRDTDLSNMYKINSFDTSKKKEITIYPFQDNVSRVKSSSSNKIIVDSTRKERIVAKNVLITKMSINQLYTDYYNKNYRRD